MNAYSTLKDAILRHPDCDLGTGATPAEVIEAESRIGSFAPDYRQFLLDFGQATLGPEVVFGLGADLEPALDVVVVTLEERSSYIVPSRLIVIYNNGFGDLCCLPVESERHDGEAGVLIFWHDTQTVEPYAASFSELVLFLLSDDGDHLIST